jgi:hypothetical protein
MKLWVTGSHDWDDDMFLARVLTLIIQDVSQDDKTISFFHLDREGAEQILGSYVAKTKSFLTGKGFKVTEFIPVKGLSIDERINKVLDQSPELLLIFNKGADHKVAKIRQFAKDNKIKTVEYKNP